MFSLVTLPQGEDCLSVEILYKIKESKEKKLSIPVEQEPRRPSHKRSETNERLNEKEHQSVN